MSKFGWSLPPGCTQRHIDEAFGGNADEDAFRDLVWDQFPANFDEEFIEKIATWAWKQVSDAYGRGYAEGQSDAHLAMEQARE